MTAAGSQPPEPERAIELHLRLDDPEVVAELGRLPEGAEREAHAERALKIGLVALKHVRGEIDGDTVRREGERILSDVQGRLDEHRKLLHARLGDVLAEYFDPERGRFADRVRRLVSEDGDLARILRSKVGGEGSELVTTLQAHFGPESPLMKTLSPRETEGLLHSLSEAVKAQLEAQRKQILGEFTLDREESALWRMRRDMLDVLKGHEKDDSAFREAVLGILNDLRARKEEAERSTRHGFAFEDTLYATVEREAQRAGDVATQTGNEVGEYERSKVGDIVVQLGPEHVAAGARIVIEAKEKRGYRLVDARGEMDIARKNRAAEVGVFVFSRKTAPDGLQPFQRIGRDVYVVWDAEDPESDVWLHAGLTVARALCTRAAREADRSAANLDELNRTILRIEKQAGLLDEIGTASKTIESANDRIRERLRISQKKIQGHVAALQEMLADLEESLGDEG
jgi:hypothetical protein